MKTILRKPKALVKPLRKNLRKKEKPPERAVFLFAVNRALF